MDEERWTINWKDGKSMIRWERAREGIQRKERHIEWSGVREIREKEKERERNKERERGGKRERELISKTE